MPLANGWTLKGKETDKGKGKGTGKAEAEAKPPAGPHYTQRWYNLVRRVIKEGHEEDYTPHQRLPNGSKPPDEDDDMVERKHGGVRSWLILDKFLLTRYPQGEHPEAPGEHVHLDRVDGSLYVARELRGDEPVPHTAALTNEVNFSGNWKTARGYVLPAGDVWTRNYGEFNVGFHGRIQLRPVRSDRTPREHENIAYATSKNPSFPMPVPFFHFEKDGVYGIMLEPVGEKVFSRPGSVEMKRWSSLVDEIMDAIAEMAGWEERRDITGVNGKAVPYQLFPQLHCDAAGPGTVGENLRAGFNRHVMGVRPTVFFNPSALVSADLAVDEAGHFMGFNNWAYCGFVPKTWIVPFVIHHDYYFKTPLWNNAHWFTRDMQKTLAVHFALGLQNRGFPTQLIEFLD